MKSKPLVSVLMPNYNEEKYLAEAIKSTLNQTYQKLELVILDDCSKDNSWDVICNFAEKDDRIKNLRNEKNLGRPKTRNKLLEIFSEESKYYMWMDSDDVVKNDILEKKVKVLERDDEIDALGNNLDYVDENLNLIMSRSYPEKYIDVKKSFMLFSPTSQGGLLLRSFLRKEKYNEGFLVSQDYELWCRLITKGYKFENLQESLYLYRQTPNQGKQKNLKLTIKNTIRIKSKYILKHFTIKAGIRFLMECFLLLLPNKFVLWLFYKMQSKNK